MMTSGYNLGDLLQEARIRWLKPAEVLLILQNFDERYLAHEPPQKPPSGSLFLFNKRVLRFFRKDGHNWRRKKDGRTVAEAFERLKVGNVEALYCYYAYGELNPNFQRRCYRMLDPEMEHIVFVHYRDITANTPAYSLNATSGQYHGRGNSLNDQPPCMGTVRLLEHSQPSGGNDLYSSGQPPSFGALRLSEHSQCSGCSDDYASGQPPSMGTVRPLERSQLSGGSVGYAGQPTPAWSCEVDSLSSS